MAQDSDAQSAHDAAVDANEQPFLDHIIELRSRIMKSMLVVVVLFVPFYAFSNDIFNFIAAPLLIYLDGGQMIATEVAAPFLTPFKLAIYTSIIVGFPLILHQIWAFVAPGLYLHEKRFAVPLLLSSIVLFYCGILFAYYVLFPIVFQFFAGTLPATATMLTDISRYLDFVLKMVFAFGLAFEIPIATLLLSWTGMATADGMAKKRPYVIIGCFVVGMLLTPPDVISQVLLAIPTWLLFELGVLLARMTERHSNEPE